MKNYWLDLKKSKETPHIYGFNSPTKHCIKMFDVTVPGKEKFLNLAKAEFPLNLEHGSDLRNILTRLLGKEVMAELSGQEIDFETLVGREVDVEIEHIVTSKREQYEYPFVQVRDIQLPGQLVKTEVKPEPTKEAALK